MSEEVTKDQLVEANTRLIAINRKLERINDALLENMVVRGNCITAWEQQIQYERKVHSEMVERVEAICKELTGDDGNEILAEHGLQFYVDHLTDAISND